MIFRGRQPAASVWRRFRSDADEFTAVEGDGVNIQTCISAAAGPCRIDR